MLDQIARENLIAYAARAGELVKPDSVLAALHDITATKSLFMLGAGRFPLKFGDFDSLKLGVNVFVHASVPPDWWSEYVTLARHGYDPGLMMARMSLAPYTWTESNKMLDPIGVDRWPYELSLKYGMRDGYTCPVGARWVVAFWSRKVLSAQFSQDERALLFMAATSAAIRLERLVGPDSGRIGSRAHLTPRELAMLRLASLGQSTEQTSKSLGLGEETVDRKSVV